MTIVYQVCNDVDGSGLPQDPATDICTTATITINVDGVDSDGDGVPDAVDLDDDNDGILDTVESGGVDPNGDADSNGIPNYLDVNATNDTNNDGVVDAFDVDGDGVANHLDLDSDNDGIYDVVETGGTDTDDDGMADDTDGDGTNDNGIPNSSNGGLGLGTTDVANNDTDSNPDFLDTDSDGDGCSDANEAFGDADTDGGDGAQFGTGDPLTLAGGMIDADGTVITADYTTGTNASVTTADTDIDNDGLVGICDADDDGDGNPDTSDPNVATPTAEDDVAMVMISNNVVIDILANDDYLATNDPANEGNTTITDTGAGTATGVVVIDPITGMVTYTPSSGENGEVTIVYQVCNDVDGSGLPQDPATDICLSLIHI